MVQTTAPGKTISISSVLEVSDDSSVNEDVPEFIEDVG